MVNLCSLRSIVAFGLVAGCSADATTSSPASSSSAIQRPSSAAIVASLRGRAALGWPTAAATWTRESERLRPKLQGSVGAFSVPGHDQLIVDVPTRADGAVRLSFRGLPDFWIELIPEGLEPVAGEVVDT